METEKPGGRPWCLRPSPLPRAPSRPSIPPRPLPLPALSGPAARAESGASPRTPGDPLPLAPPHPSHALTIHSLYPSIHSKEVRKGIARTLTVITASTRSALKAAYAGKKYVPLDLRVKKTRAIRQRLTKNQAGAKTVRAAKKAAAFPRRKYAVKA